MPHCVQTTADGVTKKIPRGVGDVSVPDVQTRPQRASDVISPRGDQFRIQMVSSLIDLLIFASSKTDYF